MRIRYEKIIYIYVDIFIFNVVDANFKISNRNGTIIRYLVDINVNWLAYINIICNQGFNEMSKYHNKKTTIDGITFDSIKEGKRYQELKLLERAKEISGLKLQPQFELQPSFKKNGKIYKKITYKADFMYFDNRLNKTIVEDVKGFKTEVYKLKKKIFEYNFKNLELREI